jgi:uncharacterized oligopeptide transporter (OPT) family protein
MMGAVAAAVVIGLTMKVLDTPTAEMRAKGFEHMIGTELFPAPQGTLMATLIKGLLGGNLDWQFVLVGAFLAITMELCGVKALSFAVGAYLPLSTTAPIFVGGALRGLVDWVAKRKGEHVEDSELGSGNLFATGLVAGGALAGVLVAMLSANESVKKVIDGLSLEKPLEHALGAGGFQLLGLGAFIVMCAVLYRVARRPQQA